MSSFKSFDAHFKDHWVPKTENKHDSKNSDGKKGSVYFGGQSPTFAHMLQITSVWLCASDAFKPFETRTDTQNKISSKILRASENFLPRLKNVGWK